jgi:lipopolysaccharide transport protein LptA
LIAGLLSLGLSALAATPAEKPPKAARPDIPVQVRCDDMVVENKQSLARCEGHVIAVRQDVTVTSDRAVAHYDEAGRVTELTCLGHVHVVQKAAVRSQNVAPKAGATPAPVAPPKIADGDRGVYLEGARTLTLTGHATLVQGDDRLAGEPIIFYVDEDRVVAKGARLKGKVQDAVAKDSHASLQPMGQPMGDGGGHP